MQYARLSPFFALIVLLSLTACEQERGAAVGVSPEQIVDDPGAYYGSEVTVSGEVETVYSPGVFTIGGDEFDAELLVLSLDSIAVVAGRSAESPVRRNDIVQISGTVRRFVQTDLTDDFGIDLGMVEDEFEDRPAIVARSGAALMSPVVVSPRGGTAAPPTEQEMITDFASASGEDGRELSGQAARFDDVTVAEMVGENSFWATLGTDSLFVVLSAGAVAEGTEIAADTAGGSWDIYGILRDVPPAAELTADWDLNEETTRELAAQEVFLQTLFATRSPDR